MNVTFYLRGGHEIKLSGISSVEMQRDMSTGYYRGYDIKWSNPDDAPRLFTMSIPDIVAVLTSE